MGINIHLRPRNFRAKHFSYRPKFLCRFADPFKAALDRIIDHVVFFEGRFIINPRRVFLNTDDVCKNVFKTLYGVVILMCVQDETNYPWPSGQAS